MNNIFEENSINPFDDPDFKKSFLKDKGLLKSGCNENYEILDPIDKEPGKIINPIDIINKASKIPDSVGNIIHDLSGSKGTNKSISQRSSEIKGALNKIMTDYNKKYGLNVHLNLDSTSEMLAELSDPVTFRSFELVVSNLFSRFKSLLYFRLMQAMYLLIDDILSPKSILSDENTIADKWVILEKVSQLFMTIEQFKGSITIEGADSELQKIGNDIKSESDEGDVRSTANVKEFMEIMLKNNGINNK